MSGEARAHCWVCDKVASLCLCGRVRRVDNRTPITIVQHPRERRHPFGTARIARLGLRNLELHVVGREAHPLRDLRGAAVLFPDRDAPTLDALPPSARPRHLVAIDGTWSHASQLRRGHPALRDLPSVRLPRGAPSRYRIRREPSAESISTIEAIVRALRILEPETEGVDGLIAGFDAMIDDQLTRRSSHAYTPRHLHRRRVPRPLPAPLRRADVDHVLLHAELHQPRGQRARFPLRVTVARPTGAVALDVRVRSPIPGSASRRRNMELERGALGDPVAPEALPALLASTLDPATWLVAWGQHPGDLARELGLAQPALSVKRWAASRWGGRMGRLADVVARLGGPPVEPWAPGRAGRQLALLARVVDALRDGRSL